MIYSALFAEIGEAASEISAGHAASEAGCAMACADADNRRSWQHRSVGRLYQRLVNMRHFSHETQRSDVGDAVRFAMRLA